MNNLNLQLLELPFGILKMNPPQPFPDWLGGCDVYFVSQTSDEFSIFASEGCIPSNIERSGGWRCFRVDGELEFDAVGIVARVSRPLADAGMSLFLVSTHDRDYVFVHESDLQKAILTYQAVGFTVNE